MAHDANEASIQWKRLCPSGS